MFQTLGFGFLLSSTACAVPTENGDVDSKSQATHVVARVERSIEASGETRGTAIAAFVQLPKTSDPTSSFRLAGLDVTHPETGVCTDSSESVEDFMDIPAAELLEADGVQLVTSDGVHSLAPHAFPGVYDLLRGVVYASRDQSGGELPAQGEYQLEGAPLSGDETQVGKPLVSAHHHSPPFPENLTINGLSWSAGETLLPAKVADLGWSPSDRSDDIITVTVSDAEHSYTCAFADADGYGAVPLTTPSGYAVAQDGSELRIEVHRLRSTYDATMPSGYQVKLNFDFATKKIWHFSQSVMDQLQDEQAQLTEQSDASVETEQVALPHAEE